MIGETLLSRYQILQSLGGGGFGDTYLAKDLALPGEPPCVVKHLSPKESQPGILEVAQALFEREATVLYQLGQKAEVPTLYAHFEQDQQFFLVQEYIEGHDLAEELLPHQPLSEAATQHLLQEILTALVPLHREHFVHRDIKPHNLRRRQVDGKLFLIDFGAVKEIRALTLLPNGETSRTVAVGSPGYMPAEQLAGRPKLASDIYAVGMIGVQALTGEAPGNFEEDPLTGELRWQHQAQVSAAFANVLAKMIHPYHLNRYANAETALEAIRAIASSTPLPAMQSVQTQVPLVETELATQVSQGRSPWLKTVRRQPKRRLAILGGVAIALLGVGLYRPLLPVLQTTFGIFAPARPSPLEAVKGYYRSINNRQFSATWKQLSPKKQEQGGGFQSYLEWWSSVDSVQVTHTELQEVNDTTALVKVELWYDMKTGQARAEEKSVIGLLWHSPTQQWLIDSVH